MNQKFIEKTQHTQKKYPINFDIRLRKFTRKKSLPSQRSNSYKKSMSPYKEQYIINPNSMIESTMALNDDNFLKQLASEISPKKQISTSRKNLMIRNHQNSIPKKDQKSEIQAYQTQLNQCKHQISLLEHGNELIKLYYNEERTKRKNLHELNIKLNQEVQQLRCNFEGQKLANKKHQKEKQYLSKQIQFLQRINYDDKTRCLQSYREKYLESQLTKIRQQLSKKSEERQKQLQQELSIVSQHKQILQSKYKALRVDNQSLTKKIIYLEQKQTESVLQSEEYITLRNKYKLFLEQYKRLRIQFKNFKEKSPENNQSLNITLSDDNPQ